MVHAAKKGKIGAAGKGRLGKREGKRGEGEADGRKGRGGGVILALGSLRIPDCYVAEL